MRRSNLPVRIAYTWAMVFLGLVLYAMFYYVFGMMIFKVIGAVEESFTFSGASGNTVTVLKLVIAWHPIFAIFGWLLYGYLMSSRRSVREYEENW